MKLLALLLISLTGISPARAGTCDLARAQAAWANGDIEDGEACAENMPAHNAAEADQRSFQLLGTAYAKGNYEASLTWYGQLSANFPDRPAAARTAARAAHHLHRFPLSREIIRNAGITDPALVLEYGQFADKPPAIALDDLDRIPFDYSVGNLHLPSFDVSVNGLKVKGVLDTGGNYLIMSPAMAKSLGISYTFLSEGNANNQATKLYLGAATFRIGRVTATNLPVYVADSMASLPAMVVFGTTFLSNFLVTLDFPRQELLLSPRGDPAARQRHLALLPPATASVPFYLWGDHYMFAKGTLDSHAGLNFFVDSGLAVFDGQGRQAAFATATSTLSELGYTSEELAGPIVALHGPLGLGPLTRDHLIGFQEAQFPVTSLGGVRIHGLISLAYLQSYVWTLDFDERQYRFSLAAPHVFFATPM